MNVQDIQKPVVYHNQNRAVVQPTQPVEIETESGAGEQKAPWWQNAVLLGLTTVIFVAVLKLL